MTVTAKNEMFTVVSKYEKGLYKAGWLRLGALLSQPLSDEYWPTNVRLILT